MPVSRSDVASIIQQKIATCFPGSTLTETLCRPHGWRLAMAEIKRFFAELGVHLGFEVQDTGYGYGEFLYDLVWQEFNAERLLVHQSLILESELSIALSELEGNVVNYDFKKLVQARADVRVWVSTSHNSDLAKSHVANCIRQIEAYSGTRSGDAYVFVMHVWPSRKANTPGRVDLTTFVMP